jgi:(1->4)-alpha-D-glucan 1-alpha-D-glucosylmutase
MLESVKAASLEELLEQWPDGRIKLFLTQRLLRFRRDHPALFEHGKYLPLSLDGAFADCCIAFAREHEGQWIAVFAPRLSSRIGFPPVGDKWQDTAVELPVELSREGVRELFTGHELRTESDRLKLEGAMATLPFAVYSNLL